MILGRTMVFHRMINKTKRIFGVIHFGLLILWWCGPRIFIIKTIHQLYGKTIFLVTIRLPDKPQLPSDFKCTTKLASADEVKELFNGLRTESPEGRYQLLVRKWYHESGYGDCYITRAADTNEICHVRWLVTAKHIRRIGWEDRFPLDENEVMSENIYTFERYRGVNVGVRRAAAIQFREIERQLGYTNFRGYTDITNEEQHRHQVHSSSLIQAKILERHFLFHVTRKTLERYDPPILRTDLPDTK